jgi:threonine synthase
MLDWKRKIEINKRRENRNMAFVTKLKCARCGREYSLDAKLCMCPQEDSGRLDVYYDYSALAEATDKDTLSKRIPNVWKYYEFLPIRDKRAIVDLGSGNTPLLKADRLASKIGLKTLYIKDETHNPTGSFKDRSMTVGVSKAVEFGYRVTATASSGNAAAALAAHSAKAGLGCYAFVLCSAPDIKLSQIGLYGAIVTRVQSMVEGKDPTVQMLRSAVKEYGWYPCPSFGPFNPYQVEGPKTMTYEIVEQLNWNTPDWIFIPTGSGCLAAGIWKGLNDYTSLDFIHSSSRLAIIQSEGCAPLVRAFKSRADPFNIKPWENPNTIAGGLADVYPWDGDAALAALRETNGLAEEVSDRDILQAQRVLASNEGIFAEPTGVASLAGLIRLIEEGVVKRDESVVVLVTGSGFKDPNSARLQSTEVPIIKPDLIDFQKLL